MKRSILCVFVALVFVSYSFADGGKKEWKNGTVVVEFAVGKDGRPTKIKLVEASDKELAARVAEAVAKWQLDKKYVGKKMRQPVTFSDEPPKPKG